MTITVKENKHPPPSPRSTPIVHLEICQQKAVDVSTRQFAKRQAKCPSARPKFDYEFPVV